jgi:plastocyanin
MASVVTRSAALVGLALAGSLAIAADGDDNKSSVNVSFGRGLNSAQPGNPVNHAILPNDIKVKVGGVVDFGVAGFHDIVIFKPGFTLEDLKNAGGGDYPSTPPVYVLPPTGQLPPDLSFLSDKIYYFGINPAGGPANTPSTVNPDNGINRGEPVSFLAPGVYLVICNVRPHLNDGMYAYVTVLK